MTPRLTARVSSAGRPPLRQFRAAFLLRIVSVRPVDIAQTLGDDAFEIEIAPAVEAAIEQNQCAASISLP